MLLTLYLFLIVALPLGLATLVALNGLPRSRSCPACAAETLRLRSRRHALLSRALRHVEMHARWCPSCEWSGSALIARPAPVPARPAAHPLALAAAPALDGVEIRRIDFDGDPWHVRLQCWAEDGAWRGRLLFVAPGGRACAEEEGLLTGSTALHVLSQVLALPDQALVGRIRKATR